jgi:PPK2 family polyphosphate:nucleotide phosphotransferase
MNPLKLATRFRVERPDKFRLAAVDPADCAGFDMEKDQAKAMLGEGIKRLSDLQERLYAQDRWAVLAIFQAMDAAGKDGAIKHVMSGINPQGVQVTSFKAPSAQELDHDFMWRCVVQLPERGRIGIFNRSYYEEVLVVRVHRELLERQKLPRDLVTKRIWQERFDDIAAFERYLARNGTAILKFFLHISKEEQRRRFLDRLDDPGKRWKFSMGDVAERELWNRYMEAYADMIRHTSTPEAPWYVIPADDKWFARLMVGAALIGTMEKLDLQFPKVEGAALREMMNPHKALLAEKPSGRRRRT